MHLSLYKYIKIEYGVAVTVNYCELLCQIDFQNFRHNRQVLTTNVRYRASSGFVTIRALQLTNRYE